MNDLHQDYAELLALAQLHLFQERARGCFLISNREQHSFFVPVQRPPTPVPKPTKTQPFRQSNPIMPETPAPSIAPHPKQTPAPNILQTPVLPSQPTAPQSKPNPPNAPTSPPTFFVLDPPSQPSDTDLKAIRNFIADNYASLQLIDKPLSDETARSICNAWKHRKIVPGLAIIATSESSLSQAFLAEVSKAIQICLSPSFVITAAQIAQFERGVAAWLKEKSLQLIIIEETGLIHPGLIKFVRKEGERCFLNDVPLLVIKDPRIYLQQPQQKSELWRQIQAAATCS